MHGHEEQNDARNISVQALAALAGLELPTERAVVVAAAIEAFGPMLESLSKVDLENVAPAPVFSAAW